MHKKKGGTCGQGCANPANPEYHGAYVLPEVARCGEVEHRSSPEGPCERTRGTGNGIFGGTDRATAVERWPAVAPGWWEGGRGSRAAVPARTAAPGVPADAGPFRRAVRRRRRSRPTPLSAALLRIVLPVLAVGWAATGQLAERVGGWSVSGTGSRSLLMSPSLLAARSLSCRPVRSSGWLGSGCTGSLLTAQLAASPTSCRRCTVGVGVAVAVPARRRRSVLPAGP
jgi:hypothetical protein